METAVAPTVAVMLTLWLIWRALWHLVWRPYTVARWFQQQGVGGPPYRFIVGSMVDIKQMLLAGRAKAPLDTGCHDYTCLVNPFFNKWASDYGKTFLYWLGPTPAICTTDMEIVKQVAEDRADLFQKDCLNPSLEAILGNGIVFSNGDDWKRRRKVVYPIFYKGRLESLSAMTSEGTKQMIEQWCAKIEKSDGGHEAEIDMRCCSEELTLGVIEQVIFGKDYKETREVFVAGKELQKLTVYALADPPIPGFRYMPTRRNLRTRKLDKLATRKISQLIEARLTSGVYGDDLLGLMLQACRSEEVELLSTDEIIGECKTFFAAGQDTSTNLLIWATFLLSVYPQWQEKLREEVQREYQDGSSDAPSMDVLGKLKLLNMFLLETLRLYSPVPFLLRKTASDTTLADIKVPKGTLITLPVMMLHRSKEVWGLDADEFNPMRFEQGVSGATRHAHAFLAFSCGQRVCAGRTYAMVQVQTIMAMILRRFSFSLSPNYVHMPVNFITVVPRHGLPLIVRNL